MFCSECGSAASGKFCWKCGSRLTLGVVDAAGETPADSPVPQTSKGSGPPPLPTSASGTATWDDEIGYERILAVPEIRERIAQAGSRHRAGISGEQFLALFDSIVPTGVSLEKLCVALQPMTASLGLKTGKSLRAELKAPAGRVLVAVLSSLASHGHTVKQVTQAADGCGIQAVIPSSLWSLSGELSVTVTRGPRDVVVTASTHIGGQLYDWGHSQRVLDRLLEGVRTELTNSTGKASPAPRAA